jgi:gliding motility-associated-like protein
VDVYPNPSAYFKIYPPSQKVVASEDEATFSDMRRCEDSNGCTFRWDFGDGTGDSTTSNEAVKHIYQQPGTYIIKLIVTNSLGCTNGVYRDSIVVVPARDLAVPNAFIPLNVPGGCKIDNFKRLPSCVFYPLASGMTAMKMQIFNRWGQQIFESNQLGEGWDGFYNRQPVPAGTYIYKIYAEFVNGNSDIITGDVTVIR